MLNSQLKIGGLYQQKSRPKWMWLSGLDRNFTQPYVPVLEKIEKPLPHVKLTNHFKLENSILNVMMCVEEKHLISKIILIPLTYLDLGCYIVGYQHKGRTAFCRCNGSHVSNFLEDWELLC